LSRLPRDLSGPDLIRALAKLGYTATRQTGSHVRLTTAMKGEHHVTVPAHDPLRAGTLSGILAEVATHQGLTREQLLRRLFGR
jgi:predicted RNA binding protein YcfA (HicA-like mRNA interferase family)